MSILSVARVLLIALAALPLVIDHNVFFPYITAKNVAFRLVMVIVLACVVGVMFLGKKEMRDALVRRVVWLVKTPVFLALLLFVVVASLGALWAPDGYRAFWGDIERAEGVVGMWFFFLLFVVASLLFDEQRWRWYFRSSLIVGGVLFVHAMLETIGGMGRPSSFLGNPIYLAVILLFVFVAALIEVAWEKRGSWWRIVALVSLPVSLVGILLTESRGVIAGMGVALVAAAVYGIIHNKRVGGISERWIGVVLLGLIVVGEGIFFATRTASVWQNVPGLDRLAQFSLYDTTLQTRVLSTKIGLRSVNPSSEGWGRLLFGWGLENYSVAYNAHYDPAFYALETPWFDRAHNKLVDVLVMNGLVGLVAYMALWGALLWGAMKIPSQFVRRIMVFFLVAYFVQNLFAFDALPMYVVLAMVMAFVVQYGWGNESSENYSPVVLGRWVGAVGAVVTLGLIGVVIRQDIVGYAQIYQYRNAFITKNPAVIAERMPDIIAPFTPAQEKIRIQFLTTFRGVIQKDVSFVPLVEQGISYVEELIAHHPYKVQHYLEIANAYRDLAIAVDDPVYFANAVEWFDRANVLVVDRPDVLIAQAFAYQRQGYDKEALTLYDRGIALNPAVGDGYYYKGLFLFLRGGDYYGEALSLFEQALDSKKFWNRDDEIIASLYWNMLESFYDRRDADTFVTAVQRLASLVEESAAEVFSSFVVFAEQGMWEKIDLDSMIE